MTPAPRQFARLQKPVRTQDARGLDTEVWEDVARVWLWLRRVGHREAELAHQIHAEATWVGTLRWAPGLSIDPTHRLIHAGRTLDVLGAIDTDEGHREVVIALKEHDGGAT